MLYGDHSPNSPDFEGDFEGAGESRRQYTLKGVESDAIELMRQAANVQGMKIGHWVSDRIKEAAIKALKDVEQERSVLQRLVSQQPQSNVGSVVGLELQNPPSELDARIRSLEIEVRELLKSQNEMLLLLASQRFNSA